MSVSLHTFRPPAARSTANGISLRWAALTDAASVVAMMAGLEQERPAAHIRNFPALVRDADQWRQDLAEASVADLAAVMEPGLTALLAVHARGADPRAAATALWHEYTAARTAIIGLLPPTGALGPRRSA